MGTGMEEGGDCLDPKLFIFLGELHFFWNFSEFSGTEQPAGWSQWASRNGRESPGKTEKRGAVMQ